MSGNVKSLKSLSRREFLKIAGGAAALSLSAWVLWPRPAFANVLPPGAIVPVGLFQSVCVRCGRCAAACPHNAIRQNNAGLPNIDGLSGWCDLCMDCVKVCPTAALQSVDPKQTKLGVAVIDHNQCIAWRRGGCLHCYDECLKLQKAISLDKDLRPEVDQMLCNGCGACVNICLQPDVDGRSKNLGKAVALKALSNG